MKMKTKLYVHDEFNIEKIAATVLSRLIGNKPHTYSTIIESYIEILPEIFSDTTA